MLKIACYHLSSISPSFYIVGTCVTIDFAKPRVKVKRAEKHLNALYGEIGTFFESAALGGDRRERRSPPADRIICTV